MTDHILKEFWDIKDGLSKECRHDLRRLFERLRAAQKSPHGKIVNRTRRRPAGTVQR